MAVVDLTLKHSCSINLNNGTLDGKVVTVSVGLGTLDKDDWDAQKVMNIIDALEPCLSKQIYEVKHTVVSRLMND